MTRVTVVPFSDDDDSYLAIGSDRENLPVFLITGEALARTPMHFPNCIRFMPDADVGEPRRTDRATIIEKYGEIPRGRREKPSSGV